MRVRSLFSGISRGTESLVFNGRVPVSEYARMRAPFQDGQFPAPVKYGYCSVGIVDDGPPAIVGRPVFCLFPHQTHYVVPQTAVHIIPDDVPPHRAVLAANMETAINGFWDAGAAAGDRITVIGAGTVGCLIAWVMKNMGACDVELIDVNPHRATIAAQLGVRWRAIADASRDSRIIVHTSGTEAGLQTALQLAAMDGLIVEMSWYGDRQVCLPLGEAFHSRRLTLKSSQVGAVAPARRAEYDFRRRMTLALEQLHDPALDALVTGESGFDDLPDVMARLSTAPGDTLCHRIRY
ncbi:MAG TPA: zinc-binding alcohol dehydrogenase [Vicinamibacterales bacterium]|nr:zinc-binding alcohol dehydrogenase [Vicinamibacterales bacterium]